jgi:hypothetical protein
LFRFVQQGLVGPLRLDEPPLRLPNVLALALGGLCALALGGIAPPLVGPGGRAVDVPAASHRRGILPRALPDLALFLLTRRLVLVPGLLEARLIALGLAGGRRRRSVLCSGGIRGGRRDREQQRHGER